MFCSNCGEKNAASSKFCKKCGEPLTQKVVNKKETAKTKKLPVKEITGNKLTFGYVVSWILALIFGVSAFGGILSGKIVPFLLVALMSLVLLPPVNKFVKKKYDFGLNLGTKIVVLVVLFLIY